jgi:hypothetical protein
VARSHARLLASIWNDDDFRALPPGPQRMYMFLISQQDLQHCGVIALRERRWSKSADGLTVDQVRADLEVLADRRYVVIDDDTEELLVRSLIRRDKVYAQPNVFKAAADQIRAVSSWAIKQVLLGELRRLPVEDLKGDARKVYERLLAEIAALTERGSATPSATPPGRGSVTPSASTYDPLPDTIQADDEPAPLSAPEPDEASLSTLPDPGDIPAARKGSRRGSATPSDQVPSEPRGKGSSYGEQVVVPLPPEPLPVPPPAGAAALVTAQILVAEWIDRCRKRPPGNVIGQISKQIKNLLDEQIDPDDIRRGLAVWMTRDAHPSALPSFVNSAMNTPSSSRESPNNRFAPGSGSRAPVPTADDIANGQVIL